MKFALEEIKMLFYVIKSVSEADQVAFSSDDHELEDNGEGEDSQHAKRRRNRIAIKENWPQEITKLQRQHEEAYFEYKMDVDGCKTIFKVK